MIPTDIEIFKQGVKWLIDNFHYRDGREKKYQDQAATYSTAWIKTINRGKDLPVTDVQYALRDFDHTHPVVKDLKEIISKAHEEETWRIVAKIIR